MEYFESLAQSIDYIEAHLKAPLTVDAKETASEADAAPSADAPAPAAEASPEGDAG